jgi:homoserine acetyltransferase
LFDSANAADALVGEFSKHRDWNGGDYYSSTGMEDALADQRVKILRSYGFESRLKNVADRAAREAILLDTAREWAREFDANSLVLLRRAMASYNVEGDLHGIRARLFYVLADTDEWFPASIGREVMAKLARAGVDATFLEVKSELGHFATSDEPEKWVPQVTEFLRQLEPAARR